MPQTATVSRGIPDAVIGSVKVNTSLLSLLPKYGLKAVRRGGQYFATCPFHDIGGKPEKTPSLCINAEKNEFHCHSCNEGGDVIRFVMLVEKLPFPRAVEKLLGIKGSRELSAMSNEQRKPESAHGSLLTAQSFISNEQEKKKTSGSTHGSSLITQSLPEEERQAILREVMRRCSGDLRNSEGGRKYLEARGLDALELAKAFEFGFWNCRTFEDLDGSEKKKLCALGLLTGTRALFENCLVFPLSKDGRIATIYGRKVSSEPSAMSNEQRKPESAHGSLLTAQSFISNEQEKKESGPAHGSSLTAQSSSGRHYLLPCKREGIFLPTAGLNPRRPVVITESLIDSLSLFAAGITNTFGLLGVNGFLPDHLSYLKAQGFPRICIALNGDDAGNRAAAQLRQNLAAQGLAAEIIQLPEGKDINDMLRETCAEHGRSTGPEALRAWFSERIGEKETDRPTVWEDGEDIFVLLSNREYRIRGLNLSGMDRLRSNIRVYKVDAKNVFHVETLDLYLARSRESFIGQVGRVLDESRETITRDVNSLITVLEELRLRKKTESDAPKVYQIPPEEERIAMQYLKAPDLLSRIARDIEACGMVGNRNNCLIAFLVALSRLLDKSLGALTISRSGAGKSFLQDLVSSFTPEESLCKITRLTGQSLFYKGRNGLKNKVMVIEEDEGMKDAMFAVRVLLSSQRLHLQGIKHDQKSGELRDFENVVEGPASILIAGTDRAAFDDETSNRFFTLYLDESPEQTRKILEYQDRMDSLEGIEIKAAQKRISKLHQNVQRLLKPLLVVNPIGTGIKYPVEILHCRREKTKIQTLIKVCALLHQHQREIKEKKVFDGVARYIEVTQADVDAVKDIAADILRHSLDDLSMLCRDLLRHIHDIVDERYAAISKENPEIQRWEITFTRKELKDRSRWSLWHIKEHVKELEEAGYIAPRMGKKGQRYSYSLVDEAIPDLPDIG